jgi:phospholipid/cholesterol/gamma-HCH transport system permease protein
VLRGALDVTSAPGLRDALAARASAEPRPRAFDIDASGIERADYAGAAVLRELVRAGPAPGVEARLLALTPQLERLLGHLPEVPPARPRVVRRPRARHDTEVLGALALALGRAARDRVEFVGALARAGAGAVAARRLRLGEIARIFLRSGVDALPIVFLVSFLTGLVIALESADPFSRYGAQILIADTIGLAMTRELGPLMTAVVLSGRSGSSIAAELGTMKVNEELDALSTMGLDPVRFLVVQRVIAGTLLTPLLTAYAMAAGIAGGVLVMRGLGLSTPAIWEELVSGVKVSDLTFGLAKGLVFGATIAGVGCHRGMRTALGPTAVGDSATRAVMTALVLVAVLDSVFAFTMHVLRG